MALPIGLVGLPNAGKSTLFNALTKTQAAEAQNYPFCTIDPNVGRASIHDPVLEQLSEVESSQKLIPESLEFVDIAGLVKNAHAGEGLGNQFLAHIRECAAIALVLRFFEDENIIHVDGVVDPSTDKEVIETELLLADLSTVQKSHQKHSRNRKSGKKEDVERAEVLDALLAALESGTPARELEYEEYQLPYLQELHLLTMKPLIIVANVAESEVTSLQPQDVRDRLSLPSDAPVVVISAQIESELSTLEPDEAQDFLESMSIERSGLHQLAAEAHGILGLQTFYTVGEKEARAWTFRSGDLAPQVASVIHTDFEKHFIKAEAVSSEAFLQYRGWSGARDKGVVRLEGKEGVIHHGDVVLFRTSA